MVTKETISGEEPNVDGGDTVCVVQCGAVWCRVAGSRWWRHGMCGAVWCNVVQCAAVCCSVVQCGVVWCSVVQCGVV